jgi:hypothetical protein
MPCIESQMAGFYHGLGIVRTYLPVSLHGDPVIFAPTKRLHFMYVDDVINHLTELIHNTTPTTTTPIG